MTEPADTPPNTAETDTGDPAFARWLFAQDCRFLAGVAALAQLPEFTLPEVAFAGRSNVGKSTLLNALTGRKALARTSHTPGRTQQLNFFDLGGRLILVDLPGYGYAKAPKAEVRRWSRLTQDFLRGRPTLRRVCLLVDARRGVQESDRSVMKNLDAAAVSYQVVLTKADKVPEGALGERIAEVEALRKAHVALHPSVRATSAHKGHGLDELRVEIASLATESRMS